MPICPGASAVCLILHRGTRSQVQRSPKGLVPRSVVQSSLVGAGQAAGAPRASQGLEAGGGRPPPLSDPPNSPGSGLLCFRHLCTAAGQACPALGAKLTAYQLEEGLSQQPVRFTGLQRFGVVQFSLIWFPLLSQLS
jgi:hypothetical protein